MLDLLKFIQRPFFYCNTVSNAFNVYVYYFEVLRILFHRFFFVTIYFVSLPLDQCADRRRGSWRRLRLWRRMACCVVVDDGVWSMWRLCATAPLLHSAAFMFIIQPVELCVYSVSWSRGCCHLDCMHGSENPSNNDCLTNRKQGTICR